MSYYRFNTFYYIRLCIALFLNSAHVSLFSYCRIHLVISSILQKICHKDTYYFMRFMTISLIIIIIVFVVYAADVMNDCYRKQQRSNVIIFHLDKYRITFAPLHSGAKLLRKTSTNHKNKVLLSLRLATARKTAGCVHPCYKVASGKTQG